ncbi:MAG: hypothetical protein JRN26_03170 [Nitrososphaerota archaeon]|nr:hypothetical protein [Nitrososphaerota archaeon]MDG6930639.1 hypothetical protein [Nitrososphaerota archaeon]MDG6935875.1 hypothetical protein [Nitrososphaerota archaeon]MDG6944196.1 hypothetical protein [Nitrososphaerota archaeon]
MAHPWESHGEKRTIVGYYEPSDEVMKYLQDIYDIFIFFQSLFSSPS